MRVVLQKVLSASVSVDGKLINKIGKGIMCLVGIRDTDEPACSEVIAKKILECKLWDDEEGRPWSRSVMEMKYEVLLVSQFTLYGSIKRKPKPDYHCALSSDIALDYYGNFVNLVKKMYHQDKIYDGLFGAYMDVQIQNDGPCTLILDTDDYEGAVENVRKRLEKEERSYLHYSLSLLDAHKNDNIKKEKKVEE